MSGTLDSVVFQLRAIATQAAMTGQVAEAAPHPDAELLTLCATVLDLSAKADAIDREARRLYYPADYPKFKAEIAKREGAKGERRSPMMRICKFSAKTAAGVYAKALVLRDCGGTAPALALSIADDLANCPGLRSSLWPAEQQEGGE